MNVARQEGLAVNEASMKALVEVLCSRHKSLTCSCQQHRVRQSDCLAKHKHKRAASLAAAADVLNLLVLGDPT